MAERQATGDLVRRLKVGPDAEGAFRELFAEFYPRVCGFFAAKGLGIDDSRELAQEVFLLVHRSVGDLRDEGLFIGWLFTISRNAFSAEIARRTSKKRAGGASMPAQEPGEGRGPEERIADPAPSALDRMLEEEKVRSLRQALAELPPQMQRCVAARVVDGDTYEQIALRLGISINTVKAHLFKAREQIGRRLRPMFGDVEI